MRIEITHKETHVQIDEFQPKDVDSAVKMIKGTIDAIQGNEPAERPEIDLSKPLKFKIIDETFQPVDTITLKPLEIHRNASECLKMLKYWDDYSLVDDGGIIHRRVDQTNTMKVVKSFLNQLISNFPNQ